MGWLTITFRQGFPCPQLHCYALVSWRNHAVAAGHQGKGTTIRALLLVSLLVALAAGIPAGEGVK